MKLLLIILALFPGLAKPPASRVTTWAVKESSVNILGSSNVNKFNFSVRESEGRDTLVILENARGQKLQFEKGLFRLPVKKFRNCNPILVKDFKKMLKAPVYPDILMNFLTLTALADVHSPKLAGQAEVDITLCGKTIRRSIEICTVRDGANIQLTGCERLKFSDFNLKPPKGVMGFIDVKNELDVEFRFVLTVVSIQEN